MVKRRNDLEKLGIHIDGPENGVHFQYLSKKTTTIESPIQIRAGKYDIGFIGAYTYLGGGINTIMRNITSIGRYCSIASNINTGQVEHPTGFLSTSPLFYGQWRHAWPESKSFYESYNDEVNSCHSHFLKFSKDKQKGVVIGSDVWIGEGVYIYPGVNVGDGSIIATRSIVTKDVEPYSIVAGIPAKVIKYRFSQDIISRLLKIKWWIYDHDVLNNVDFANIETAVEQLEKNINTSSKKLLSPNTTIINKDGEFIDNLGPNHNVNKLFLGDDLCVSVMNNTGFEFNLNIKNKHELDYFLFYKEENINNPDNYIASLFVKENDFVLDVGANIGFTSSLYRNHGAKSVYAYEPVSLVFNRLVSHCSRDYNVRAFNFALSDKDQTSKIYLSQTHHQGSTLIKEMIDVFPSIFSSKKSTEVKFEIITTRKLDSLNLGGRKINFIKLDVEGSEINVIRGGIETITSSKPRAIQVEAYGEHIIEIHNELSKIYKNCYRLEYIDEFTLVKFDLKLKQNFQYNPPIYIFTDIDV